MPIYEEVVIKQMFQCNNCKRTEEFISIEEAHNHRWVVHYPSDKIAVGYSYYVLCPTCMDIYVGEWGN